MHRTLAQARLAQGITVGWMLVEGVIAVGAGVVAHSVALTAFGFDSFIELFSAAVVLRRVLERSESEERGSPNRRRTGRVPPGWVGSLPPCCLYRRLCRGRSAPAAPAGTVTCWHRSHRGFDRDHDCALEVAFEPRRSPRQSGPTRRRSLLSGVPVYGDRDTCGTSTQRPVRMVVGRPDRRCGFDLVDPRRSERGPRGSIFVVFGQFPRRSRQVAEPKRQWDVFAL